MFGVRLPFSRSLKNYIVGSQVSAYCRVDGWLFSAVRAKMICDEMHGWLLNYCPIDLEGKVVLDVGAGEGETAKFFLNKGAKKVIAVESDKNCFINLARNAGRFPVDVVFREFRVGDLFREDIGFAKIDIEGYEEQILGYKPNIPCVVEVHGLQLRDRFIKEGWRVGEVARFHCLSYAFWKC